ncbi:unnamed protein product [Didymodactylos carnosus]|uniref:SET domain-containing protein n=1 Tax=Didymodactylos carnosus TaxID=1234261 RepID=A0A813T0J2_9BILA|nr:unnamed protein product [Didymodactylos carnosus]CAF1012067.1 unnamed protein product [Didymodactylos carnosus]CAF3593431.1 unnamed protein product [Didymodactylos carnosus]CAF3780960.1 unnamed protein product [Didymodactylos carnosus]
MSGLTCILCYNDHTEDECEEFTLLPKLPGIEKKLCSSTTSNLSKVLLSLPTQIQLRRCDDSISFYSTVRIFKNTIIGPYDGRFIPEDKITTPPRNGFLIKIFRSQGNFVLDARDERKCNWCTLIPPAKTSQEINCLLFQRKYKLYAKVVREIKSNESLNIWYSANYAQMIRAKETPDGDKFSKKRNYPCIL